jgi:hypothetical protein
MKPLRRPRTKSNKKKGRKERKLHSLAESLEGTSMIERSTDKEDRLLFLSHRLNNKQKRMQKRKESAIFLL